MAFSSEDKHKIIFALCHSGNVLNPSSTLYNSVINDRLNDLSSFTEEQALGLVSKIERIKSSLENSPTKNNVKRIGDIELDTDMGISLLKKEYKRLTDELSKLLDIPNRCSVGSSVGCVWV